MSTIASIPTSWQAGFLSILPAVQKHARMQFRRLPTESREEAIQEAVASACVAYQLLASQGRLHVAYPGTLSDFAVRHVRTGRHVGGKQDTAKDVLSPSCQKRHGVCVQSCCHIPPGGGGVDGWKSQVLSDRRIGVADLAAFRIDFAAFLHALAYRDRRIIAAMVSGERTFAIADRFGLTAGRVSQLRRKYERSWHVFQAEAGGVL